ncbi:MAG TPA: adenosine deaminase [Actinomycetota bacterium]|nr:adenosine deaminase [Actinomycetota bacterium]
MPGERDLVSLPKVELHVHLEGSMRAPTVVELADRYGVALPEGLRDGRYGFRDFRHFIDEWLAGLACLRAPEDLRRIALEFCEDEAAQGVRYAEVSFSLPDHAERLDDPDAALEAVLDGLAAGERASGIVCRVYVDVVRGIDLERSRDAMRAAVRHRDRGVIGIGLGGEERFPPETYADIFREAREAGLRSIPHAGETHGPGSIRGALQALGADRIGHGIRILEDPELVAEVRDRGIGLDVCPTSNAMTRSVPSLVEHPLPRMLEAGLLVTLNSDDPSMFGPWLSDEYAAVRDVFGLDDVALARLAGNGVRASFADDGARAELDRAIQAWLASPGV